MNNLVFFMLLMLCMAFHYKMSVGGVENAENIAINRYGERFCCSVEYIFAFEEFFA